MNEQILKLWSQAEEEIKAEYEDESRRNRRLYNEIFLPKFAELIVKECINEIAYIGKANEVFGDRTDRGGLNHILWTTETAIEKIREHFGVEE
jgi:hypothetical protein